MSQQLESNAKGFVCGAADLVEGVAVKIAVVSNVSTVVIATAATDKIIGVTQGKYKIGEAASIKLRNGSGTIKVKAGGTVAIGDRLTSDGSGRLIATTTAANEVVVFAVEAGVVNDLIEAVPAGYGLYAIT